MDDVQGHSYVNREVSKSSLSVGVAEGNRIRERVNSGWKRFWARTLCFSGYRGFWGRRSRVSVSAVDTWKILSAAKAVRTVEIRTEERENHEKRENSHPGRWKTWKREISHPGAWKSRKTWKFTPWTVKNVKTWKFTSWSVKNVKIHICKRENTIWLRKSDLDSEMQKQGPGRYGLGFRSRMVA